MTHNPETGRPLATTSEDVAAMTGDWVVRTSTEDVLGRVTPESYLPRAGVTILHRESCWTLRTGLDRQGPPRPHARWPYQTFDLISVLFAALGPQGSEQVGFCQHCAIEKLG